ncbi:MAG: thio(seleno)oxazole modification radical SAM maturase SbtM [Nitrospirota bacterium]
MTRKKRDRAAAAAASSRVQEAGGDHVLSRNRRRALIGAPGLPAYRSDLARIEQTLSRLRTADLPKEVTCRMVNPTVSVIRCSWKNLLPLLERNANGEERAPEEGEEILLLWKMPGAGDVRYKVASSEDLLALKMVFEDRAASAVAAEAALPVGAVDAALDRAAEQGILLAPPSLLRRDPALFHRGQRDDRFLSTSVFTLQWHITQACDLHCKHCYDRSARSTVPLEQAFGVLDDLRSFCRSRGVSGQVSFTGGNPLLHPHFTELYRAAVERGLTVAILGNPSTRKALEELAAIQRPAFFQVSLEGLLEHNDAIRGPGHFDRVIDFLRLLRELDIYSMVMLTLTRNNMEQVLPLADLLRGITDTFTFNRLSAVGEGARLQPVPVEIYPAFLERYAEAAEENPIMGLKDSLINILHQRKGLELFGGCAGFGCGAAFNFAALLPDGEVHACRKFPSPIGTINTRGLAEIYDSAEARRYREGCSACAPCPLRPVCGGCLAVAHSAGKNIFKERDPYCFVEP